MPRRIDGVWMDRDPILLDSFIVIVLFIVSDVCINS